MLRDNLLIDSLADVEPWGSKAGELGGVEVVLDPWPPHHPLPVMGRLNSLCQDHVLVYPHSCEWGWSHTPAVRGHKDSSGAKAKYLSFHWWIFCLNFAWICWIPFETLRAICRTFLQMLLEMLWNQDISVQYLLRADFLIFNVPSVSFYFQSSFLCNLQCCNFLFAESLCLC